MVATALASRSVTLTILLALAPTALFLFGAFAASSRVALLVPALGLSVSAPPLNRPLPFGGGHVAAADVVILLAVAGWIAQRTVGTTTQPQSANKMSPVLGWPLALFGTAAGAALVRGHYLYGQSFFGDPTRLFAYAAIALVLVGVTAAEAYRIVVAVFYVGTVWMSLNAAFYMAAGRAQTTQISLSTGGSRVLSITVSMYMASALFLALLNLQKATTAAKRAGHVTIACLATFGVVLGYGRAVFAAAAAGVALLLLSRQVRHGILVAAPLLAPALAVVAIFGLRAAPDVVPAFVDRITASPTSDANVIWRERLGKSVWDQVRESPLTGVGFGRSVTFRVDAVSSSGLVFSRQQQATQDPHNSFLWLLAAGGIAALGTFLLICGVFLWDAWRRWRTAVTFEERTLLAWAVLTLSAFCLNTLTEPTFGDESALLTIWTLLLLPSVVPLRSLRTAERGTPATAARRRGGVVTQLRARNRAFRGR